MHWYRKAADQGEAYGQSNLGRMYRVGRGVAQDDAQAVHWYRKAAEQGDAAAQTNLGWMYENGRGIAQDEGQAILWYRKAAEQGNSTAQQNLVRLLNAGLGLAQKESKLPTFSPVSGQPLPQTVRGPKMTYKPDYGLHLIQDGISRTTDISFYDFRLYSLTVLGPGQYSTMIEMPIADELHALSLDFNQRQLDQILSYASPQLASFIRHELVRDPSTPRTIDFTGEVVFGVRARLGEIQRVERESFVPFVAQEIML